MFDDISKLEKELRKAGIPFRKVTIEIDPSITNAVHDYIMKIEEAHKRAAESKLRFGVSSPISQIGLLLYYVSQNA